MQCQGITKSKQRCKHIAKNGLYCHLHQPKVEPEEEKCNKSHLNLKFLELGNCDNIFGIITIKKDILKVFENLKLLRILIDSNNPGYNYKVSSNVITKFKKDIKKYIKNPKRINLVVDFMFEYKSRNLTISFTKYDFLEPNDEIRKLIDVFRFRGYESKNHPIRKIERKDKPKVEKKDKPKPEDKPKPKPEDKPKQEIRNELTLRNKLKEFFVEEDLDDLMKIIIKPTSEIRPISRKDVLDMYRKFHPDKCIDKSDKAIKICNMVSAKLSVLKKQFSGSSSPVRTIKSIFDDVWNILD